MEEREAKEESKEEKETEKEKEEQEVIKFRLHYRIKREGGVKRRKEDSNFFFKRKMNSITSFP